MKYLIIPVLIITALLINVKISSDIKWQKRANYRFDKELKSINQVGDKIYMTNYWGLTEKDLRVAIGENESKKFKAINYVIAQEKYYRGK